MLVIVIIFLTLMFNPISLCLIYLYIPYYFYDSADYFYKNWDIRLVHPDSTKLVYMQEVGIDFKSMHIWYYSEDKFNELIQNEVFTPINADNKNEVNDLVKHIFSIISDESKELFNKNFDYSILEDDNYYYYYEQYSEIVMLITNEKNNSLYVFQFS